VTLQEQLIDAKAQYHLLVTGQAAKVFVDQNGERVEYVAANRASLLTYINGLAAQISEANGTPLPVGPMRILM